jgi:hypothetical protein
MTSEARIAANRRNAEHSTGPRTSQGKARSRQNARKHGLSISIGMDPTWVEGAEELADAIWRTSAEPQVKKNPHLVAALVTDVLRTASAKADLLNLELARLGAVSESVGSYSPELCAEQEAKAVLGLLDDFVRLQRYEDRAEARIRRVFGP